MNDTLDMCIACIIMVDFCAFPSPDFDLTLRVILKKNYMGTKSFLQEQSNIKSDSSFQNVSVCFKGRKNVFLNGNEELQ